MHPIGANWIAGYFGIGGFSITCNVTFRSAAVQIYLGKQDTQKNKAAFDYLYQKKNEIEDKLGDSLHWERANDSKYSSINYTLEGVSIGNETDWTRMAKFHAEWSKKMSDVIVPYLKELYPTPGD